MAGVEAPVAVVVDPPGNKARVESKPLLCRISCVLLRNRITRGEGDLNIHCKNPSIEG